MNPQPAPSAESLKQITHLAAALKAPRITESAARLELIHDPLVRYCSLSKMNFRRLWLPQLTRAPRH